MQVDHHLLLKLWDKAVGQPEYDKEQWMELSNQVNNANTELAKSKPIPISESTKRMRTIWAGRRGNLRV